MIIRHVIEADIAHITRLLNWAIDNTTAHFGTTHVSEAEVRAEWVKGRERYPWFAARDDRNDFLGYAKAGPFRTREAYAWTAELTVYVEPTAHGKGVGKALYQRVIASLKAQGYRLVLGGVATPNAASEALHRSVGLVEMGRFPKAGFKFGRWIDVVFFGAEIGDPGTPPQSPRLVSDIDLG